MYKRRPKEKDERAHARRIKHLKHEPKLTIKEVDAIRREYVYQSSTHGIPVLAKKYGVSRNTIYKVIRGKTWKTDVRFGHAPLPDGKNINWKLAEEEMRCEARLIAYCEAME